MFDYKALFKITYGLYIVCTGDKTNGNGFISNTVFQVTSEPAQFAASCNKDNFTCQMIEKSGVFSVSILHQDTPAEIIGRFGYKSGKDFNKMESLNIKYGETGVPIVLDAAIATLEFKVVKSVDMGTHMLFMGELVNAEVIDGELEPLTYAFYREVKKGLAPKNAPTYIDKSKLQENVPDNKKSIYKCAACGYIYDSNKEDIAFEDLPDDWICPVCGSEKEDFMEI